jgi:hypothetical protein
MRGCLVTFVASAALVACGGGGGTAQPSAAPVSGSEPTAEPQALTASSKEEAAGAATLAEVEQSELPTACSRSEGSCTPDRKWVERLCSATYPSVALSLFSKGSPWTRGYLTRKTQAWNAAGGASEPVQLDFDEEVLVLLERTAPAGGIQVSGAGGGFEVLRWDGGCVTLAKEELTLKRPPQPFAAKVEWRFLDLSTRDALSSNEKVKNAYQERRKECKGAMSGTVSLKCVKADTKLSQVIVEHVRGGGDLGKPEKLP